MKRRRAGSLTGGTGDVNPQYFIMQVTQTGNDVLTEGNFPIPIQRLQDRGMAQVMEVLSAQFTFITIPNIGSSQTIFVNTKSRTTSTQNDPSTIATASLTVQLVTSGMILAQQPYQLDLTGTYFSF